MSTPLREIPHVARAIVQTPGLKGLVLLALVLAVGAKTAMHAVVDTSMLKAAPYPGVERLVAIWAEEGSSEEGRGMLSFADLEDGLSGSPAFEAVAGFQPWRPVFTGTGGQQPVSAAEVSESFFQVLGIEPVLGRSFLPEEQLEGRELAVVLSYRFWKQRFEGDPAILEKLVMLDGRLYTVVGILPADFRPLPSEAMESSVELYRPLIEPLEEAARNARTLRSIARLKAGVTIEQARQALSSLSGCLERQVGRPVPAPLFRLAPLHRDLVGRLPGAFTRLFG